MQSERRYHFPVTVRLRKRAEFQRIYREGVRVTGRHIVVFLMPAHGQRGRFGVTASRKVGGAAVRSRCKRRLRELYRIHIHRFEGPAVDIVANARHSVGTAPWDELEKDFLESIERGIQAVRRTIENHTRPT